MSFWGRKKQSPKAPASVANEDDGFDLDVSGLDFSLYTNEPFQQTGRLPLSSLIKGTAYRWHDPRLFWRGEQFWQTFEDGPWKWSAAQRYAGKDINCGHYFSLAPEGASAEAGFYGMNTSSLQMLKVTGDFDAILDLTYEDNLVAVAKEVITNWKEISERHFLMEVLSHLVDLSQGGNDFTSYVGYWASRKGYDGILFFGARALQTYPDLRRQIDEGADETMGFNTAGYYFRDMRKKPDLMNLVMLSGSALIRSTKSFEMPLGRAEEANPYYRAHEEALDRLFKYNREFQESRRGFFLKRSEPAMEIPRSSSSVDAGSVVE